MRVHPTPSLNITFTWVQADHTKTYDCNCTNSNKLANNSAKLKIVMNCHEIVMDGSRRPPIPLITAIHFNTSFVTHLPLPQLG